MPYMLALYEINSSCIFNRLTDGHPRGLTWSRGPGPPAVGGRARGQSGHYAASLLFPSPGVGSCPSLAGRSQLTQRACPLFGPQFSHL